MNFKPTLIGVLVATLAASPVMAGRGPGAGIGSGPAAVAGTYQTVDESEASTLLFMREEERLARDVYLAMAESWQAALFDNIAAAEQRHMDAVKSLMDKYGLEDLSDPDASGLYSNNDLQAMYGQLMAEGLVSYQEALRVGALIEEVDIDDNENAIAATDNTDLQRLYANLARGSRNHLRAFVAEIERLGVVYKAQYLSPEDVDSIVDSPMERGGNGGSQGRGGQGRR